MAPQKGRSNRAKGYITQGSFSTPLKKRNRLTDCLPQVMCSAAVMSFNLPSNPSTYNQPDSGNK